MEGAGGGVANRKLWPTEVGKRKDGKPDKMTVKLGTTLDEVSRIASG